MLVFKHRIRDKEIILILIIILINYYYHRFFGTGVTADCTVSPRHVLRFTACFFIVRICTPQPGTHWLRNRPKQLRM